MDVLGFAFAVGPVGSMFVTPLAMIVLAIFWRRRSALRRRTLLLALASAGGWMACVLLVNWETTVVTNTQGAGGEPVWVSITAQGSVYVCAVLVLALAMSTLLLVAVPLGNRISSPQS